MNKIPIYLECIVQLNGRERLKAIKLITHATYVVASILYIVFLVKNFIILIKEMITKATVKILIEFKIKSDKK